EPIVRKLIEGAGGKLLNFYFTTGDADFLLITETNEAESAIAALLAAAAGTISDVTTSRAWTGAEFKAVADKASKVASLYSPPGKK
ncbi:MAG: GYD domain-containing protein, partial [Pseudolabrys sp.]